MITPYDWKLAAVNRDIEKCQTVKSSLEAAGAEVESFRGNTSILQEHLNECFGVAVSASSFTEPIRVWHEEAIFALSATIARLEESAASLAQQQVAYRAQQKAKQEQARREAAAAQLGTY